MKMLPDKVAWLLLLIFPVAYALDGAGLLSELAI